MSVACHGRATTKQLTTGKQLAFNPFQAFLSDTQKRVNKYAEPLPVVGALALS
jgi:hypothetical protein